MPSRVFLRPSDYRGKGHWHFWKANEGFEIMSEEEVSESDLSGRLATVLEEIRDVMEKRKQRIEELRQEITNIENDNEELEKTISELLDSFG